MDMEEVRTDPPPPQVILAPLLYADCGFLVSRYVHVSLRFRTQKSYVLCTYAKKGINHHLVYFKDVATLTVQSQSESMVYFLPIGFSNALN